MMPNNANEIARASEAIGNGRIDEADRLLSGVLKSEPESAEAHHLRALALLQRRDTAQALMHAETALSLAPQSVRYRCNLGATLLMVGQSDAALTHFDQAVSDAPDYLPARRNRASLNVILKRFEEAIVDLSFVIEQEPDQAESRVALADALVEVGRFKDAAGELKAARKIDGKQSPNSQYVWGRLMFRMGRFSDARQAFTIALQADPGTMNHFLGLAAACFHCGNVREAERITRASFQKFPSSQRSSGTPELRVLVLEAFGHSHFSDLPRGSFIYRRGNFIAHLPPGRIAYTHIIADQIDSVANVLDLEQFDIAYNNCAVHETIELQDRTKHREQIVAELRVPLVNGLQAVAQTTRVGNAETYATAERFIFPRTMRIEHGLDPSPAKKQILDRLKLPVIIRPLQSHVGVGVSLVHNERELEDEIAKRPFSESYVIEYHDCRSDDELFRRYRFACVDGRLSANSLHVSKQWSVHGEDRKALGWVDHGFDREELAFFDAPDQLLGAAPDEVFEEIVDNTALDIYGFDFGFRRDGRLVVFEINAAMGLGLAPDLSTIPYRKPYADRLVGEIEALFLARSRRNGTATADQGAS